MFPFIKPVYAQCPICVITVGGGLLIAKKLGIDDLLVSIWLSGLNSAIAFWMANSLKKKVLNNGYFWSLIFYGLTIVYLFYTKQLNHPGNKFLGVDKVFFGMTVGLLIFFLSAIIDQLFRKIKKGKALFSYQKVIIPLVLLSLVTFIFRLWI